jgi:sulfur carrier protein
MSESVHNITKITLNGEISHVKASNLLSLIEDLGLDAKKVALEKNLEIVPRSAYLQTPLCEGDRIEIVHFVGGGN